MLSHQELSQINQKIKANELMMMDECDKISKDLWDHKDSLDLVRQENESNRRRLNISFGILFLGILILKLK